MMNLTAGMAIMDLDSLAPPLGEEEEGEEEEAGRLPMSGGLVEEEVRSTFPLSACRDCDIVLLMLWYLGKQNSGNEYGVLIVYRILVKHHGEYKCESSKLLVL